MGRRSCAATVGLLTLLLLGLVACNGDDGRSGGGGGAGDLGPDAAGDDAAGQDGAAGPCTGRRDCPPGEICNTAASPAECVAASGACEGNEDCPAGFICQIDECVEGCNNRADCYVGWVCREVTANTQRCQQSCERNDDCGPDQTCSEDVCIPRVQLCSSCALDQDCGGTADLCVVEDGQGYCGSDCSVGGGCPDGFYCDSVGVDGARQCVAANGQCETVCPLNPCPEGTVCNRSSGECRAALKPCDPCESHSDCEGDARCRTYGQDKVCLLPCPNGASDCGDDFVCTGEGNAAFCVPKTHTCDRCAGRYCGPLTPHCNAEDGNCVECLASRHCGPLETCGDAKRCVAGGPACDLEADVPCEAPTPFCFEDRCVECISSGDCPAGGNMVCHHFRCMGEDFCQRVVCPQGTNCDNQARRCLETGTCETDADCPGRRCDVARAVCYNADGSCLSSGECPQSLECDPGLRLCVNCSQDADCRPLQACFPLADGRRYCHQL